MSDQENHRFTDHMLQSFFQENGMNPKELDKTEIWKLEAVLQLLQEANAQGTQVNPEAVLAMLGEGDQGF